MKKLWITFGVLSLLLLITSVAVVSSYYCIYPEEDNPSVQEFKMKLNSLALEEDFKQGLNSKAVMLKLKYFNPCR
jgi:hypothetical protein